METRGNLRGYNVTREGEAEEKYRNYETLKDIEKPREKESEKNC